MTLGLPRRSEPGAACLAVAAASVAWFSWHLIGVQEDIFLMPFKQERMGTVGTSRSALTTSEPVMRHRQDAWKVWKAQRQAAVSAISTTSFLASAPWQVRMLTSAAVALFVRWRWQGRANSPALSSNTKNAKGKFDWRRVWTALNVGNHAIYAVLFIIRSFFYTGAGSSDRPFYYESFFLGWLCGPAAFLPTLLGWDNNRYNQPTVLTWMKAVNSASSTAYPQWITVFISDPRFMYFYQIAEGIFHCMIVLGGLRAFSRTSWPPREDSKALRTFRWGLLLELVVMDITYVTAFSCLPMLQVPGHYGLTTIMMLIHHVNVLPDIVCGWYEWKAMRSAKAIS
jgi:hypothetical protein